MSALLVVTLFSASCSTNYQSTDWKRSIAAEVAPPLNVDQLFSVKTSAYPVKGQDFVKAMYEQVRYTQGVDIKFVEDPKMEAGTAFKIVPVIEEQAYKVRIFYSAGAKFDQDASAELSRFLNKLLSEKFLSPYALFELYYNAKAGDFVTLHTIAKLREDALSEKTSAIISEGDFKVRQAEALSYWKNINDKFEHEARIYNKGVKAQEEARRSVMDALDKASDDGQFRNLVARNDRKGAAKLLRSYLPWEQMPPFEKLFWENHLTIMADPLPLEDRILIYRGINDDIIQVAQIGGKELTREEAIKEQQMFLMSTMMTKNQGTWNRRLRSLTAMYEKFMGTDNAGSSEYTKAARITNMFVKHSSDPKGSPFLSYTPKYSVSHSFGNLKNTAYFIDPRIMYFNYASRFANEVEFLLPIMSFPEDLAAVIDFQATGIDSYSKGEAAMRKLAVAKLEKEVGVGKGEETMKRIELNSKKYFKPVMNEVNGAVKAPKPDGKFVAFFKSLFGMPTKKAAEVIDEKSDMPCLDLIQLFWK